MIVSLGKVQTESYRTPEKLIFFLKLYLTVSKWSHSEAIRVTSIRNRKQLELIVDRSDRGKMNIPLT